VLLKDDLRAFLAKRYAGDSITAGEIEAIIRKLDSYPAADLYESNKAIHKLVADGFVLKREPAAKHKSHRSSKDLYIQLIDYTGLPLQRPPREGEVGTVIAEESSGYGGEANIYRLVSQLAIEGDETRIPGAILTINGLPLVVFEFKSAIREETTLHDAWRQLTTRYARDIPELMKYNALCVLSDGVNSRMGSLFAPYEFFYTWRKVTGDEAVTAEGISSLHSMVQGLFDQDRLRQVIRHFIHFPDVSRKDDKIVCRYPQFYAATKLYRHILEHRKRPDGQGGDGKGGTYFGATGCGKSYTMLFLTRLLMKSLDFESPTIVLITVGFTGTPIDATLDVFGEVVDSYTMTESVKDGITVRIVYEGRAVRLVLNNAKLQEIEAYYGQCAEDGASEYQIEESKKASANMNAILGDPDRIKALAADFVRHYETRVEEGSTVAGKAMFVCSNREIAYAFWQAVIALRPQWNEVLVADDGAELSEQDNAQGRASVAGDAPPGMEVVASSLEQRPRTSGATQKDLKPMERLKMVMTRGKDDPKAMYDLLGTQDHRKELDRQFKNAQSNFKIAIVVDMWLTGFDVPFLDTIYIDKPIRRHNLIQTISRVNRRFEGKNKGLVVDYVGIKKQMCSS
jgi:type I site-specific restriction-modification system R (restriction) subunit